jgi:hypothetical protein
MVSAEPPGWNSQAPTQGTGVNNENATYGEKELTALLKNVGIAKLGQIIYSKHYHDMVETRYDFGDSGKFAEVKLFDYRKAAVAEKMVQLDHPGAQEDRFEAFPAFRSESDFGYYHLDIAAGRFGLYLRGPKDRKTYINALATGIIQLLQNASASALTPQEKQSVVSAR